MIQINTLRPNPKNPRVIKDEKFRRLVDSLRDFPKMMELRPIITDENNIILGGNMRHKALIDIGYEEIPDEWVRNISSLTEQEKRQFIIKDNVSYGEWDHKLLKDDWDVKELIDWGLEIDVKDEKKMLNDDGFELPSKITTDIVLGDYFEIGPHRLLCGDSRSQLAWKILMQDQIIDLMCTDPPYNVDYEGTAGKIINDKMEDVAFYNFLLQFHTAAIEFTKPGGSWYVFHADSEGRNFRNAFEDSGLMLKQCLIWKKSALVMGRQDYQWIHEPILYGWKPGAAHYFTGDRTNDTFFEDPIPTFKSLKKEDLVKMLEEIYSERTKMTVMEHDKPSRNFEHPTMKPIPLVGDLIANSSKKGQIVADGFGGSGTTMVASDQLERRCFMMELDPKFCQVIVDRMKKNYPGITIKKVNAS